MARTKGAKGKSTRSTVCGHSIHYSNGKCKRCYENSYTRKNIIQVKFKKKMWDLSNQHRTYRRRVMISLDAINAGNDMVLAHHCTPSFMLMQKEEFCGWV